jgi:hypothetical protein
MNADDRVLEGWQAYRAGAHSGRGNPYERGTSAYYLWREGWTTAALAEVVNMKADHETR